MYMETEIIVRLFCLEGRKRLTVTSSDTFGELKMKVAKEVNYPLNNIVLKVQDGRELAVDLGKKLREIPYFKDGAVLNVETRGVVRKQQPKNTVKPVETIVNPKCTHPPGGKCLNCIDAKKQQNKPKCNHGPTGKCLNCANYDPKQVKKVDKQHCQHGPNAKCVHCLDAEFISDIAHTSFDQFLQDKKLKCKGVHSTDSVCNNCLPPSRIQYEVDLNCKLHEPYPKAMCSKCAPPNVVIKRQEYRHVDYVEFMNIAQIQQFVRFWVDKKKSSERRVGFLYGYYAEDPNYKGGIRVIVQALYEPLQVGEINNFKILDNQKDSKVVGKLTKALSLVLVGWIYTENNHDCVMDEVQTRRAAAYQQKYKVSHETGYEISNFITVVLRSKEYIRLSRSKKPWKRRS